MLELDLMHIDWQPSNKKLRDFSRIALLGFGLLAWVFYTKLNFTVGSIIFAILAVITPILGLINPRFVRPIFVVLSMVAFPIGLVISTVLLASIYFLLFMPLALAFRMCGRDSLCLKKTEGSNWLSYADYPKEPRRYYQQF